MQSKTVAWLAGIVGLALLALAAYYWLTPSGALPTFLPGYTAGSAHVHFKHGLASLILGVLALIWAWFASGQKHS